MKKFRPFLALLLACWLLAVPALADGELGGDTSEFPPASDSVEDAGPPSPEEAPSEGPPASEDPPSETEVPPDTSDDTPSFPDDSSDASEDTPPVADDTPGTVDPVPVDPEPGTPADLLPEDPAPAVPGTPVEPLPENPVPEIPVEVPDVPAEVPPVYTVPDASLVPDTFEAPVSTVPAVEDHQVFTITTIPEFALAALESDAGNTMAQVVRDLFGTYTPRVQVVSTYVDGEVVSTEEQYVPGVAGMDWEWIGGFIVFLLMLYCLFRLLGGSVKYG